jgi:hypothetical protein
MGGLRSAHYLVPMPLATTMELHKQFMSQSSTFILIAIDNQYASGGITNFLQVAFWTYFSITNVLTDCALIVVMILIARRIQTSWSKRILIMGVFGSRIL